MVNARVYTVQGILYTIVHYILYCTGRTWYDILYHCMHNIIIKIKTLHT